MESYNGTITRVKLFGGKPIHDVLGGGKVANLLLWRDKKLSAAVLAGVAVVWSLFEIFEYNFITLLCHITITGLLVLFIWSKMAERFGWIPPKIPEIVLQESTFKETVSVLNQFLSKLFNFACGIEPNFFFLAVFSLWIISTIGNYVSSLNLLFFGLLCLETLPFLYERYEEKVDDQASKIYAQMKRTYIKLTTDILGQIPRAEVKEKGT